ncbi:MAG: FGGY family carbohydrate kinase [Candidatus Bathyarchaeota archaeon]|nr:FGGY family carbohydrate kinase [Candidatus Bathyarchaeota archaeon]
MSDEKQHLVIFDIGTTAAKTIIFDASGSILGKAYQEYPTQTPSPGIVEQNPEDWWMAIRTSAKKAFGSSKIDPKDVAGIGVITQRATVAPVNKNAEVLYPAMTWMDARSSPSADALSEQYPQRGMISKILWLKDNLPDIFKKAYKFITVDAYVYYKLTGNFVSDFTNSAYGPLDIRRLRWSDELSDAAKIPIEKFSSLLSSGKIVGELLPQAANEVGLAAGTPVVIGGGDQQCSALGLNAISPGIIKATTGTGTFVDAVIDEPIFDLYDPLTRTFCIPHVIPNKWAFEAVLPGTGLIYRWLRDQFSLKEVETARSVGVDTYDILNLEAASVKPGSDGLIIIPLFMFSRGIVWGLSFSHTKAHLARAILESAGYGMNFFIEVMGGQGIEVSEIRVDGGGARSALWRQIQADITGKPIVLTRVIEDASALGAAILTSYGVGLHKTIDEAITAMVKVTEKITPIPENCEVYDRIYPKFADIFLQTAMETKI